MSTKLQAPRPQPGLPEDHPGQDLPPGAFCHETTDGSQVCYLALSCMKQWLRVTSKNLKESIELVGHTSIRSHKHKERKCPGINKQRLFVTGRNLKWKQSVRENWEEETMPLYGNCPLWSAIKHSHSDTCTSKRAPCMQFVQVACGISAVFCCTMIYAYQ